MAVDTSGTSRGAPERLFTAVISQDLFPCLGGTCQSGGGSRSGSDYLSCVAGSQAILSVSGYERKAVLTIQPNGPEVWLGNEAWEIDWEPAVRKRSWVVALANRPE